MVANVLVPIRHHCTAPIPTLIAHDVNFLGQESICGSHHRTDVEIMRKIFNAYMKGMPTGIKISHDRLKPPIAIPIHHIPGIAVFQQFGIEVGTCWPGPFPRTNAGCVLVVPRSRTHLLTIA